MAKLPGRRTTDDAREQAYFHGRNSSLAHPTDSKPLSVENIIYLEELRRQAIDWVSSIDTEIRRIEYTRKRLMEQG